MFLKIQTTVSAWHLATRIVAVTALVLTTVGSILALTVGLTAQALPFLILSLIIPAAFMPWIAYHAARSAQLLKAANTKIEGIERMDLTTGLLNRIGFIEKGRNAFLKARAENAPLSAVVVDVDHLKAINHQHGFGAGDAVLAYVAQTLMLNIQSGSDIASRYGGAEFVLFLPEADHAWASAFAERLRGTLANRSIPFEGKLIQISASFGVASILPADLTSDALIARASKALEAAKAGGRNTVKISAEQRDLAA